MLKAFLKTPTETEFNTTLWTLISVCSGFAFGYFVYETTSSWIATGFVVVSMILIIREQYRFPYMVTDGLLNYTIRHCEHRSDTYFLFMSSTTIMMIWITSLFLMFSVPLGELVYITLHEYGWTSIDEHIMMVIVLTGFLVYLMVITNTGLILVQYIDRIREWRIDHLSKTQLPDKQS